MAEALRKSSLQRFGSSVEPKMGVSARAQSEILWSKLSICSAPAPRSGAQTQGSLAALTAETRTRSQPGANVAALPHACPFGSVVQPAADKTNAHTQRRIDAVAPIKRKDARRGENQPGFLRTATASAREGTTASRAA